MTKKSKKITTVHAHSRRVKPSHKTPKGVTIVHEHLRSLPGTFLDELEIYKIANGYNVKNIPKPTSQNLGFGDDGNAYDSLKIIQDPKGEAKDFVFNKISQKDLKNPDLAISIAIRWLAYKKTRAEAKLNVPPTHEEIILEYKGLLKSKSKYKKKALERYRELYAILKK